MYICIYIYIYVYIYYIAIHTHTDRCVNLMFVDATPRSNHVGITWTRLQGLAVKSVALGGLGLFADGSMKFQAMLGVSPPTLMEDRPECYFHFVKWLLPKEATLERLVEHDLATRDLRSQAAANGLETLKNRRRPLLVKNSLKNG